MPRIDEAQTRELLRASPDKTVNSWQKDAPLIKSLTKVLNASLDVAADAQKNGGLASKQGLALAMAKKSGGMLDTTSKVVGGSGLKAASFVTSQTIDTIGLIKVAGYTPAKATLVITLTMAKKVVGVAGMAQMDKCKTAIASLAVTTGLGVVGCSIGIGCLIGAISIAADAFDVYAQCSKDAP
jgi:hypothetical protein